jgi:hypothetical protein
MNKATVVELAFTAVMQKLSFTEFVQTTVKFDDVLYAFTKDCTDAVKKIALGYLMDIVASLNDGLPNSEKVNFYERSITTVTRKKRFWTK